MYTLPTSFHLVPIPRRELSRTFWTFMPWSLRPQIGLFHLTRLNDAVGRSGADEVPFPARNYLIRYHFKASRPANRFISEESMGRENFDLEFRYLLLYCSGWTTDNFGDFLSFFGEWNGSVTFDWMFQFRGENVGQKGFNQLNEELIWYSFENT